MARDDGIFGESQLEILAPFTRSVVSGIIDVMSLYGRECCHDSSQVQIAAYWIIMRYGSSLWSSW